MNTAMLSSVLVMLAAMSIVCRATPVQFPFADEKAENDSQDTNEVGPEESWELYNQITKSNGAMDEEKTNRLMHEIEEFTRLIHTPSSDSIADEEPESVTSEYQADPESETEHDYASSDWFASTWRTQLNRRNENEMWQRSSKRDDDNAGDEKENMSNIEEIIKKLRNDMKKLYNKIKEVVKMVKTWVIGKRGSLLPIGEYGLFPSASESDGVFVIAEPLVGDTDKSNKYTVPIFAD